MHQLAIIKTNLGGDLEIFLRQMLWTVFLILAAVFVIYAQSPTINRVNEDTLIIENPQGEVYSFGKNVIVKGDAKGVLVFGGDAVIEGNIDGDVAVIGGAVVQKETAFVSGDVIVFGGEYKPESKTPLRTADKQTIVFAVFEQELRNFAQNPAQIFSPSLTVGFLAQRVLLLLFWFIISLVVTTVTPGAVSRAAARFQISALKVIAFGMFGLAATIGIVMSSVSFLPNYIYAIFLLMAIVLLIVSFVFGRVALQVSVGKRVQKMFVPESKHSETLALLIGAFAWTLLLSLPYVWIFALIVLVAASLGLVLTARSTNNWRNV